MTTTTKTGTQRNVRQRFAKKRATRREGKPELRSARFDGYSLTEADPSVSFVGHGAPSRKWIIAGSVNGVMGLIIAITGAGATDSRSPLIRDTLRRRFIKHLPLITFYSPLSLSLSPFLSFSRLYRKSARNLAISIMPRLTRHHRRMNKRIFFFSFFFFYPFYAPPSEARRSRGEMNKEVGIRDKEKGQFPRRSALF